MSGPNPPGVGDLLEDEARQQWITPPSPSITGQTGPATAGDGSIPYAQSATSSSSSTAGFSSSSSAFHRRRQHTIAAFLKQGESNETFRHKAPSILTTYWSAAQQQQQAQAAAAEAAQLDESKSSAATSTDASLDTRPPRRSRAPSPGSSSQQQAAVRPAPSGFRRLLNTLTRRLRPSRRRRKKGGAGGEEKEEEESSSSSEEEKEDAETETSMHRRELEAEEDIEATNFSTVDWGRMDERDMLAYHRLQEPLPAPKLLPGGRGCCGVFWSKIVMFLRTILRVLQRAWRAGQGWVLCGLVGFFTGLLASMIDMCVHWVIDFRVGMCKDNWWLNNNYCCAAIDSAIKKPDRSSLQEVCPLWQNWDIILNNWGLPVVPMSDYISNYVVYVVISGVLATVSCWLVASFARYAAGSGIPEIKTILGGVVIRRVLGPWTLFTKCIALVLSVSSGLQIGKEGPFVHIAACVGNILCKIFKRYRHNQAKTNEILSAACAAGVAVAFGAPIGGILYSLEEVSSYFPHKTMWRAFFCAIIASISITYIDPYQEGKLVQFQIDYTNPWQWFEMVPFFLIGCLGGLVGAFFIKVNLAISRARKKSFLAQIPLVEVCIVAMLSSLIKFQSAYTRGNTTSLLGALFSDCSQAPTNDPLDMCNVSFIESTMGSLLFTTVVSLLLTTYSIGLPVPSGLLIPSLTIGAAMGRLVGTGVWWLQITYPTSSVWSGCELNDVNCITPGIYALVGGAAVLGGVTRMTIALVVIMFEITGGLTYLLPIMVAVVASKVVGDSFGTDSIYEGAIEALNYPFLDVKHEIPSVLKIKDAMTPVSDILVLTIHGHTVSSLTLKLKTMASLNISGFPIVTTQEEMLVVGYITRTELKAGLRYAMRHGGSSNSGLVTSQTPCYFAMLDLRYPRTGPYVDLSNLLDPAPVQVSENMALYRLHDMFCKLGLRYCLVARFGKMIGICTKKDIIKHLHEWEHQQQQQNHKQGGGKKLLPH